MGSLYLAAVCVLPEILVSQYAVPCYFGGTSLLIVVSVTMDTVAQIHRRLLSPGEPSGPMPPGSAPALAMALPRVQEG